MDWEHPGARPDDFPLDWMPEALHISNGDATDVPGTGLARRVIYWRDVLHEGPVPEVPPAELREGDRLNVFVDSATRFHLQEDGTKPMIFVSVAGAGIMDHRPRIGGSVIQTPAADFTLADRVRGPGRRPRGMGNEQGPGPPVEAAPRS